MVDLGLGQEEILYCNGCPEKLWMLLGNVQGWIRWGSGQPGWVEGIPVMAESLEPDDLWKPKLLYDSIIALFSKLDMLPYFALV